MSILMDSDVAPSAKRQAGVRTWIDLNADCGESFGAWTMGHDEAVMPLVSSVNLACGGHAGDPPTMLRSVRLALRHGVAIGAHPSYPDLAGFGRRSMVLASDELYAHVLAQVGSLQALVKAEGGRLRHVKPHGALYHDLERAPDLARAFVQAVSRLDPDVSVVGSPKGTLEAVSGEYQLRFVAEGFVERRYLASGQLVPRQHPDAQWHDLPSILAQAEALALHDEVRAIDGTSLHLRVATLCLHGDRPDASELALALRTHLQDRGVQVRAP